MTLREETATLVLDTYLNFCQALQRDGSITDKNFNRIRSINHIIGSEQESVKAVWGDLFDEIFYLLNQPEIRKRLEKEKREVQQRREKQRVAKQKAIQTQKIERADLGKKSNQKFDSSKQQKGSNKPKKTSANKRVPNGQPSKSKKQKQRTRLKQKQHDQRLKVKERSIKELRGIFIASLKKAQQDEQLNKKVDNKPDHSVPKPVPTATFDSSSISKDIMDERKAEGKGYGGSK